MKQQKKIDKKKLGTYAIDSYGLKTMNKQYFAYKLHLAFETQYEKLYKHLASHTIEEFKTTIGPMKYLIVFPKMAELSTFLFRANQGEKLFAIQRGSFF